MPRTETEARAYACAHIHEHACAHAHTRRESIGQAAACLQSDVWHMPGAPQGQTQGWPEPQAASRADAPPVAAAAPCAGQV